jgi:segregation and condensation protein B
MGTAPDRPSELPPRQGLSFHALSEAFARALGRKKGAKKQSAESPPTEETSAAPAEAPAGSHEADRIVPPPPPESGEVETEPINDQEDPCQLCPRTILEAMLFVGNQQNEPLTSTQAAELMRGVDPSEIPELVDQLNKGYATSGAPYEIVSEGAGYRLVLRRSFADLRDKFFGRVREARLSQAAVDILAIVAYRQPLSLEDVNKLRGRPCNAILSQLVRRQLLRIDRPAGKRQPANYYTTDRFLALFGLQTIEDLPQAEDLDTH